MRSRRLGGFTLVELLVALAVAGVFLSLLYQAFLAQERSFRVQEDVTDARQNARVAVDELTRALASLGAGTEVEAGQPRLLVAHEHEITFTADLSGDHDAQPPGAPVPGAGPQDPLATLPAGGYAASPAETYRFRLVRRAGETFHTLVREVNGGADQAVALMLGNPARGEPLFRYLGDFDGDGDDEWLDRVDRSTSPRVAAGVPLDALVRRIEIRVLALPARTDPRAPAREVRLTTAVTPRNLWTCPRVVPIPSTPALRAPDLRGTTTPVRFRVLRGAVPEAGRTVRFELAAPAGSGAALAAAEAVTDAGGYAEARIAWPTDCTALPEGTYTVTARTAEPPTLLTPFGACASDRASVGVVVGPGVPAALRFDRALVEVESCGGEARIGYRILDACGRAVSPEDAAAHPVDLAIGPDPEFGTLSLRSLDEPEGAVLYRSPTQPHRRYAVPRSPVDPNRFPAWISSPTVPGRVDLEVVLRPGPLTGPTANVATTAFADCPDPILPVVDTFGLEDGCENPLHTLEGTGERVVAELVTGPGPAPDQGAIASPGNRGAFSADPVDIVRPDPAAGPGAFAVAYRAPTCTLGGLPRFPRLRLTPSWNPGAAVDLPVRLDPCTGCGVRVLDAAGAPTASWNRACGGDLEVVVTRCVPAGTTVELVIVPEPGSLGLPSFDRNAALDRARVTFTTAGAGQEARLPLYVGTAQTGDRFRVEAYVPDRATAAALGGVTCSSPEVSVDTSCAEILISAVPDNPGAVPTRPPAADTPLCAAEGSEVFFRVKDCDQNLRDYAADDIRRTAGSTRGLVVQVLDADGTVLDEEGPDLFEVDVHGTPASDSPYFQGRLTVTQDPGDRPGSGRLRAPPDRVVTLRATYYDPDDPTDRNCRAEALLVPPLPVCLTVPAASFADWDGDLLVHGGDALVAGNLRLPGAPTLLAKDPGAPLLGTDRADRFFNAYVGGTVSVGGTPLRSAERMAQPFTPGGPGAGVSTDHPNYFQNVPAASGLAGRLDTDRLRLLARARGVYWEPAGAGLLRNPRTGVVAGFQEITALPGPGTATALHDGRFVFVDAPAGLRSNALLDAAAPEDLPTYRITGAYYTEGLLVVAGNVVFAAPGAAAPVAAEAPATGDARYDEGAAPPDREDLPLGPAPGTGPVAAGSLPAHARAALYAEGVVRFEGPWRWYGAVTAEKGIENPGGAAVWYDPAWADTRLDLCSRCCRLTVDPPVLALRPGTAGTFTASGGEGTPVWESLAPWVAAVGPGGAVRATAEGAATVRATDGAGCVAEAEVSVSCGLALEIHPGPDLRPGDRATVAASGVIGGITWTADNPAAVSIAANLGPAVEIEARAPGPGRIEAEDTNGCTAGLDLAVNCPAARIALDPPDPSVGDRVRLHVLAGPDDLTDRYGFFADGVPLAGRGLDLPDPAARAVSAEMAGGLCPVGPVPVVPRCPVVTVTPSPLPARVGESLRLAATGPGGEDWSGRFDWTVSAGTAEIAGDFVTPSAPGPLVLTGDWAGCPAGPVEVSVEP